MNDKNLKRQLAESRETIRELQKELKMTNSESLLLTMEVDERMAERTAELRIKDLAIESSNNAIAIVDLEGNLTYANPSFPKMWGYDDEKEVLGRSALEFWQKGKKAMDVIKVMHDKGSWIGDLVAIKKDGSLFDVLLSASIVTDEAGKAIHMIASFLDVTDYKKVKRKLVSIAQAKRKKTEELEKTYKVLQKTQEASVNLMEDLVLEIDERKKAEEEISKLNEELEQRVIQRTAELEAANKEIESFAYSVSHDLRAPLRSLDGFSQAVLEDCKDKLDEQGKDYLQRIRYNSQHMAELIDDILKLSRVTRAEMSKKPVDLSVIAKSIATELKEREPNRQVEFIITEGLAAKCDKRLIKVVMNNLFYNAWKFTSKHTSARIEFGALNQENETTFFVRDDGAGFESAYAEKLFGAFQRLHTTKEFEGTGIGLATVQRIISRHGGKVWAEGAVEKGATFYFTL